MSRGAGYRIRQANRERPEDEEFEIPSDEQLRAWSEDLYRKVKKKRRRSPRGVRGLVRRFCFERDDWACTRCGRKDGLTLHHVIPKSEKGPFSPTNLVTLCAHCHTEEHRAPADG